MSKRGRILVVDDDPLVLDSLILLLEEDYEIVGASSGKEAVKEIGQDSAIDAVILDIKMAEMDGLEAATKIEEFAPDIPIIFYTGYPGDYSEDDIEGKHRPFGYVTKNQRPVTLRRQVRNAVEFRRLQKSPGDLVELARSEFEMIGMSEAMQGVFRSIETVAPRESKVMILGETGTGKELVARAIHRRSRRSQQRLAIFNCNHKSADLVESELFGHVKGAFTSAVADRTGLFEYADGGTVFLDEIGDLDVTTQAKLLRVLETGEYQPLGQPEYRQTDVRVICATHRDLDRLVKEDKFREDLHYRLKNVIIELPPLRERREDIPLLIDHFLEQHALKYGEGIKLFQPVARDLLFDHDWPGNVRELENVVYALADTSVSGIITAQETRRQLGGLSSERLSERSLTEQVRQYERSLIVRALRRTDGNITRAAEVLKVDRANLSKKIKAYNIDLPEDPE